MDSLKDYLHTMISCNHCGQCKWLLGPKVRGWNYSEVCPIHQRFNYDAYSGQGLINIARELLEGKLKYEEGLVNLIYTCTTCGACDVNCKSVRDMEVMDTILALRAKCVEDGQGPMPLHKETAKSVEQTHNIYGMPHDQRFEWLREDTELDSSAKVAYFVGCSSSYLFPELARNTVKILNAAGVEFKLLEPDEYCCGASLWRTGQVQAAREVIEHNTAAFKKQGIETIITSCAECYGTLKNGYPRFTDMNLEVLHITEVIQRSVAENKIKLKKIPDIKVTYHDPCLLGRLSEKYVPWNGQILAFGLHEPPKPWRRGENGVYEAPREILKAIPGVSLVEMTRNSENSYCCGAGGGVSQSFPNLIAWIAKERLDEAQSTGVDSLISCCPFCKSNFQKAISENNSKLKYLDLTEIVAKAL